MEQEIDQFKTKEIFLEWIKKYETDKKMTEKDADLLLGYLEGHDYALGCKGGDLYRMDIAEEHGEIVPYTMDELIDLVCDWNYELLQEAAQDRDNPENFRDFCRKQDHYENIRKDGVVLNELFEQTSYGKDLRKFMQQAEQKEKASVPVLAEQGISYPVEGERRK
jgi:hypothetical protein